MMCSHGEDKRKLFSYENLKYLCTINGITPSELRKKLGMSLLQFSAISWPRASKKVAEYFEITREQFLYSDLSIPAKYRDLLYGEGKEQFCMELLKDVKENLEVWKKTDDDLVKELHGSGVYKQVSLYRQFEDYSFVVVINAYDDEKMENGFKVLPESSNAFGYIKFDAEYKRIFKSIEDATFKMFCDELLFQKHLTIEKWKTIEFYQRKKLDKISGSSKIPIDKMRCDFIGKAKAEYILEELYGISLLEEDDDNEKLRKANLLISLIEGKRLSENVANGKKDIKQTEISETDKNELIQYLQQLKADIIDKIAKDGKRLAEEKKKRAFEERILSEVAEATLQLGCWDNCVHSEFVSYINSLSLEEFCLELKEISFFDNEKLRKIIPEYNDNEIYVIKMFLWCKRIDCFRNFKAAENIYDFDGENLVYEIDKVRIILSFIDRFKKNELTEYCGLLSSLYATILIYLYCFDSSIVKSIQKLKYLQMEEEAGNCSLDELYNDLLVLHGMKEPDVANYECSDFESSNILALSNAQWTSFFEDTDDSTIERALPFVFKKVQDLFIQKGIRVEDFFKGRKIKKRLIFFSNEYNTKLDTFIEMIHFPYAVRVNKANGMEYSCDTEGIYVNGVFSTIELKDCNDRYCSYPLVDSYLATYICKYMENQLRIISKYKTKASYKYGGYYCIEAFSRNSQVPEKIVKDYIILVKLIESGELRAVIYDGVDEYLEQNPEELLYWKNRFCN